MNEPRNLWTGILSWLGSYGAIGAMYLIMFDKSTPIGVGGLIALLIYGVLFLIAAFILKRILRKLWGTALNYQEDKRKAFLSILLLVALTGMMVAGIIYFIGLPQMGDPHGDAYRIESVD